MDAGAWTIVTTTLTSPTWSRALTPTHTYGFRVRAVDKAGNDGDVGHDAPRRGSAGSRRATGAIHYTGTWTIVTEPAKFWSERPRSRLAEGRLGDHRHDRPDAGVGRAHGPGPGHRRRSMSTGSRSRRSTCMTSEPAATSRSSGR